MYEVWRIANGVYEKYMFSSDVHLHNPVQRYKSFQEKYFTLILQTVFYQQLLILWPHLYVHLTVDRKVMSHIFYFSNWELWLFKNTSSGILFKLRIVSDFAVAVSILMPVRCGRTNGKIQQISRRLSLHFKEFLPDMRQFSVIHLVELHMMFAFKAYSSETEMDSSNLFIHSVVCLTTGP
jgi:hypothetical protein